MSNINEMNQALKILTSNGLNRSNIVILHCNTAYPTPYKDINLYVQNEFKKEDLKSAFGLSSTTL